MSETLFELISGIESSDGYLTDAWLDRLRAFEFSPQEVRSFSRGCPISNRISPAAQSTEVMAKQTSARPQTLLNFTLADGPALKS